MLDMTKRTALAAIDLLLPSLCIVCGRRVHPGRLAYAFICPRCEEKVERLELPVCPICGVTHTAPISGKFCKHCPPRPLHFDMARAVVHYNEAAAALVKSLKYERLTDIGDWMGNMMFLYANDVLPLAPDVVVPVPLHFTRRMRRGFNQADMIARRLCALTGWPLETQALARVKMTLKQSFVTREERDRNVRDAFEVMDDACLRDKTVMIVDDVLTSGSSANECARMIRQAGARRIIVYTFARA